MLADEPGSTLEILRKMADEYRNGALVLSRETPSSVEIGTGTKDEPYKLKAYCEVGKEHETAEKMLAEDAFVRQQLGLPPRTPFGAA